MKSLIIIATAAGVLASCTANAPRQQLTQSGLDAAAFDTIVDGQQVALYTLTNANGLEACITNFGGRVVSLMVPDRDGTMRDVVLGHDRIADYIEIDGNFGALIGRYGNRIDHGHFAIDTTSYELPQNDFGHCLHGGPAGYHNKVWNAELTSDSTLTLTLHSPDGDEGFPGNLDVAVTYTLTNANTLDIDYTATTDQPTIVNLTNHSYFNLSGDGSLDITSEELMVKASGITPIDSTFMTSGEILAVDGTAFDFRQPRVIADALADTADVQLRNGRGIDHNFVLDNDSISSVATVYDSRTGIQLDVVTDQPGLQVYIGNFLNGSVKGKGGVAYPHRSAICLETQHYPDSPNKPEWPSVRLNPGEQYHTATSYIFTTRD